MSFLITRAREGEGEGGGGEGRRNYSRVSLELVSIEEVLETRVFVGRITSRARDTWSTPGRAGARCHCGWLCHATHQDLSRAPPPLLPLPRSSLPSPLPLLPSPTPSMLSHPLPHSTSYTPYYYSPPPPPTPSSLPGPLPPSALPLMLLSSPPPLIHTSGTAVFNSGFRL